MRQEERGGEEGPAPDHDVTARLLRAAGLVPDDAEAAFLSALWPPIAAATAALYAVETSS